MTDFKSLDEGRQADVSEIQKALRYSTNPRERAAAKRALEAIKKEQTDPRTRDIRKWLMNERKQGRHENVKALYEDIEKNPRKYNPYGNYGR